jgi:DNA-directed RNA polymerase sigma subunit (sigma70/sigma32)
MPPIKNVYQQKTRNPEIIRKYLAGQTLRQLAAEYGVSFQRIHQILEQNEIKLRKTGRPAAGPPD